MAFWGIQHGSCTLCSVENAETLTHLQATLAKATRQKYQEGTRSLHLLVPILLAIGLLTGRTVLRHNMIAGSQVSHLYLYMRCKWLILVCSAVGAVSGETGLSSIGVDFDGWTEESGISINDGAVFWMDPTHAEPIRQNNSAPASHTVLAHITVPATASFTAVFGEIHGKSIGGSLEGGDRVADWEAFDIAISNGDTVILVRVFYLQ